MSDSPPPHTHTPSLLHPVFLLDHICCPHLRTLCLCLVNTPRPAVLSGAVPAWPSAVNHNMACHSLWPAWGEKEGPGLLDPHDWG